MNHMVNTLWWTFRRISDYRKIEDKIIGNVKAEWVIINLTLVKPLELL